MRGSFDIRGYKKKLRMRYKTIRQNMVPEAKAHWDSRIRGRIFSLPEYKACKTVLCFVSTAIEVDTHTLINQALAHGKAVAVPYCVEGSRRMKFYRIHSLDDLVPRTFGVLEPDPARSERVYDFSDSICILPGIAFDRTGFRLGYGGGYYDRFLSKVYHGGVTVGVCYTSCVHSGLPRGRFDVPCDILITERHTRRIDRPAKTELSQTP